MKLHLIPVFVCLAASAAPPAAAQATSTPLTLIVSSETAPAGGWVQIKVFAAAPCQITFGILALDFDPTVFGDVGEVAVFSATGDAWGSREVNGNRIVADLWSSSGGIGQLPGVPLLVVSMPVHAGLPKGRATSVTVDPSYTYLADANREYYSLTSVPGTIGFDGALSIQSMAPGGGLLPAGTAIQIAGTGFDASTTASLDGVSISPSQFLSSQQMKVTLGAPAELTGKHLHLGNAAGEQADYFSALPQAGQFFPLTTYRTAHWPPPPLLAGIGWC